MPADLVSLATTDEEGLAFIETAELDGETNLKIKVSLLINSYLFIRIYVIELIKTYSQASLSIFCVKIS